MYLKFKVFTLELHISWYDWPAGIEKKMNTIHIFKYFDFMNIQYTLLKNNLFLGISPSLWLLEQMESDMSSFCARHILVLKPDICCIYLLKQNDRLGFKWICYMN